MYVSCSSGGDTRMLVPWSRNAPHSIPSSRAGIFHTNSIMTYHLHISNSLQHTPLDVTPVFNTRGAYRNNRSRIAAAQMSRAFPVKANLQGEQVYCVVRCHITPWLTVGIKDKRKNKNSRYQLSAIGDTIFKRYHCDNSIPGMNT